MRQFVSIGIVFACMQVACERPAPKLAPTKPAQVLVALPITQTVTEFEEFTGRTDAVHNVNVRARVTGYLDKVHFKEGNDVKEGDLLFEIDTRTYKAELERAEANVAVAEAHLARLERDFARSEGLLKKSALSREEYDKIAGDRDEAIASVRVAKASRDLARLNVSFCKVLAPVSGQIGRSFNDPGNLVKADETMLTTIVSLDPMYAYFDVDERTLLRLRQLNREAMIRSAQSRAAEIELGLTDEEGYSLKGTIDFVDNKLDSNTGTLRLRGVFSNPNRRLSPGLFVRIRMPVGDPHPALMVSEQALGTDQGTKFVYVVDKDNKVVLRRVKIGLLSGSLRVIEEGIQPTERVLISGLQRVKPGATVEPMQVEMPTGSIAPNVPDKPAEKTAEKPSEPAAPAKKTP